MNTQCLCVGVPTLRYIPLHTRGHSVLLNTSLSLPPGPQLLVTPPFPAFLTSVIQSLSVHLTTYKSPPEETNENQVLPGHFPLCCLPGSCTHCLWGPHSEPNFQEWPHSLSPLTPVTPCSTAAAVVSFSTCHLFAYLLLVSF